jgi:hypothetical protein
MKKWIEDMTDNAKGFCRKYKDIFILGGLVVLFSALVFLIAIIGKKEPGGTIQNSQCSHQAEIEELREEIALLKMAMTENNKITSYLTDEMNKDYCLDRGHDLEEDHQHIANRNKLVVPCWECHGGGR